MVKTLKTLLFASLLCATTAFAQNYGHGIFGGPAIPPATNTTTEAFTEPVTFLDDILIYGTTSIVGRINGQNEYYTLNDISNKWAFLVDIDERRITRPSFGSAVTVFEDWGLLDGYGSAPWYYSSNGLTNVQFEIVNREIMSNYVAGVSTPITNSVTTDFTLDLTTTNLTGQDGSIISNYSIVLDGVVIDSLTNVTGVGDVFLGNENTFTATNNFGGDLLPTSSNVYNLGSSNLPWAEVYAGSNSVYIGSIQLIDDGGTFAVVESGATNVPGQPLTNGVTIAITNLQNLASGDGLRNIDMTLGQLKGGGVAKVDWDENRLAGGTWYLTNAVAGSEILSKTTITNLITTLGGGNPFDQDLNQADDVIFNTATLDGAGIIVQDNNNGGVDWGFGEITMFESGGEITFGGTSFTGITVTKPITFGSGGDILDSLSTLDIRDANSNVAVRINTTTRELIATNGTTTLNFQNSQLVDDWDVSGDLSVSNSNTAIILPGGYRIDDDGGMGVSRLKESDGVTGIWAFDDNNRELQDKDGNSAIQWGEGDRLSVPVAVKTTTGDPGSPNSGDITINEFDNVIKIYADGAWRTISSW